MQPDYPYGRQLRCQRRCWVESKAGKGMRFCTQTNDPRKAGISWNNPKQSTYSPLIVMMFNESTAHIGTVHFSGYSNEAKLFIQFWTHHYRQLDDATKKAIDGMGEMLARANNSCQVPFVDRDAPPLSLPQPPYIEAKAKWFYSPEEGLFREVYAQQHGEHGEGKPSLLPVFSALVDGGGKSPRLLPLVTIDEEISVQARQIVQWHDPSDYPLRHWVRAVLEGWRGFEWEGESIYDRVMLLASMTGKSQRVPALELRITIERDAILHHRNCFCDRYGIEATALTDLLVLVNQMLRYGKRWEEEEAIDQFREAVIGALLEMGVENNLASLSAHLIVKRVEGRVLKTPADDECDAEHISYPELPVHDFIRQAMAEIGDELMVVE